MDDERSFAHVNLPLDLYIHESLVEIDIQLLSHQPPRALVLLTAQVTFVILSARYFRGPQLECHTL